VPVLILSAVENGVLEEIVMIAYLLTRLRDLRLGWWTAILTSAVIRGSYHLYQGFGGFVGNLVMGLVFGYFFRRTRRVMPLIVAHSILDIVSFVGYALLKDHLGFLS
jgi:membrane protease YdiL (CAAX protease family)